MFSLQQHLGKEKEIFRLLEASAQEARNSVQALAGISKAIDEPQAQDEFGRLRLIDKQITQEISNTVYTAFVTMLDREDIEELSLALYKVPKMVDKFTERLLLSPANVRRQDFSAQIGLLESATEVVVEMVRALRKEDLAGIRDLNEKLQLLENQADQEMLRLYGDLFNGHHADIEIVALKDLYEQLERVIDRCRDAGNVIAYIGLKNS